MAITFSWKLPPIKILLTKKNKKDYPVLNSQF